MSGGTATAEAFQAALKRRAAETEAALDAALSLPNGPEARVVEAMRYAALSGGKRLRAFLAIEAAALFGADGPGAARLAAAVECVHAYSLVHDDLPCMDDDALRRGRATAHIAFDEETAVLAGDALQTRAFEILSSPETHPSAEIRIRLVAELAAASGAGGMVGGQMLDMLAEKSGVLGHVRTLEGIERLQALKTGALIRASALSGCVLGGGGPEDLAALGRYAEALGRAFQIRDDLLDLEGDRELVGKAVGKDAAAGKATFVSALGREGALSRGAELITEAQSALSRFGEAAALLRAAADFAMARNS